MQESVQSMVQNTVQSTEQTQEYEDDIVLFGFHTEKRNKSFYQSIQNAHIETGMDAFQMYMKSPRSWAPCNINCDDADKCKQYIEENNLFMVAHGPYLVNIAADTDTEKYTQHISTIINDLYNIEACGGVGAIYHVGKYKDNNPDVCYENMAQHIFDALQQSEDLGINSNFILETAAGQKSEMLTDLVDFGEFYRNVVERLPETQKNRFKVCIDTCHVFSAGYDLSSRDAVDGFEEIVTTNIGWDNVELFHFNDSLTQLNSRVDRHQTWGAGFITEFDKDIPYYNCI